MIILGIDTATDAATVGLVENGRILCEYTLNNGKNHSVKLVPMIEKVLEDTGLTFPQIDAYACGVGPGSFTGIRIGVATAKGFAQAMEKPVLSISSLELLAENIKDFPGLRVSLIYARADEVFCAAYNENGEGVLPPSVMTIQDLLTFLKDKGAVCFCGDGALKYRELITETLGTSSTVAEGKAHILSGGLAALLGETRLLTGGGEKYSDMEPVYLRLSQAEREYLEKEKGEKE